MNWKAPIVIVLAAIVIVTCSVVITEHNRSCTLTYDANGGTGDIQGCTVQNGSSVTISAAEPSFSGFRFAGWSEYRFAETGNIDPGDDIILKENTTLYATWVPCGDIIVLTDPGLDDAVALCNLFAHYDLFDSITVIAVGGNMEQSICLTNLRKVAELSDMTGKITVVSTNNIVQNYGDSDFHGKDGLGDLYTFTPTIPFIDYNDWIGTVTETDWLLSLGGCTVTKMIIDTIDVKNFALMGGSINVDPYGEDYEYNESMDPDAFKYCVTKDHRCVTLDTGGAPVLDAMDWNVSDDTPAEKFFSVYRDHSIKAGDQTIAIWDDIAMTYVLHPHYFTHQKMTDKYGTTIDCLICISDHYETCGMPEDRS